MVVGGEREEKKGRERDGPGPAPSRRREALRGGGGGHGTVRHGSAGEGRGPGVGGGGSVVGGESPPGWFPALPERSGSPGLRGGEGAAARLAAAGLVPAGVGTSLCPYPGSGRGV